MSPFHPFDHIGNAGVTLVIEVVRIIFLLAFLVFLKSSSSSNRSCGQEATACQTNPGAAGSSHFEKLWPPLPGACSSLSRGTTCQQGAEEEQQPSAVSVLQPKPLSSASPRPTCCSPDLPSPEISPILITGRRDIIRGARGSAGLCAADQTAPGTQRWDLWLIQVPRAPRSFLLPGFVALCPLKPQQIFAREMGELGAVQTLNI